VLKDHILTVKRLVRDSSAWWQEADNADKCAFPRKACTNYKTKIVGPVVHMQRERI
jgi:hypothetical protein